MSYTASWDNSDAQGHVTAGVHNVKLSDAEELIDAINRRRLLTYHGEQDFSTEIDSDQWIDKSPVSSSFALPFDNLRANISSGILSASPGSLGGSPASPTAMDWLWPLSGSDQDKVIVSSSPDTGEVSIFQKLNTTSSWTDPTLTAGVSPLRAVHFNEMRQSIEWIHRGRWEMPIYFTSGLFSLIPDTSWFGELITHTSSLEIRTIGFTNLRTSHTPVRGLVDVAVRSSSYMEVTVDMDCTVEAYRCLRDIDFADDPPTWEEFAPDGGQSWATAGGIGAGDSVYIGSIDLLADTPGTISTGALQTALQAMVDGSPQNFLLRRGDTESNGPIVITAQLVVEFDLDSPPN